MTVNLPRRAPEPGFARTAALIADPSRARMLALLLGGEARSADALARAASITAQTASTHLAQLLDANLVALRTQGRRRDFTLADADVAYLLEALSFVAERDDVNARWHTPAYKRLKHARSCYCHLAGELGVRQHDALIAQRVLVADADGALTLGDHAAMWSRDAGFDDAAIASLQGDLVKKRFAHACMDWSERREHLAGVFATKLLSDYVETGWLRKDKNSRALTETPRGVGALQKLLTTTSRR